MKSSLSFAALFAVALSLRPTQVQAENLVPDKSETAAAVKEPAAIPPKETLPPPVAQLPASQASPVKPAPAPNAAPTAEIKALENKSAPLTGCAASLQSIADAYRDAHDKMVQWISESSSKVSELDEKKENLKSEISEKEGLMTKLKLDSSKDHRKDIRDLNQETKQLWKDLSAVESENSALCKSLSRGAAQQVRELNGEIMQRLEQARAGLR